MVGKSRPSLIQLSQRSALDYPFTTRFCFKERAGKLSQKSIHNVESILYWIGTFLVLFGLTSISTGFISVSRNIIPMP